MGNAVNRPGALRQPVAEANKRAAFFVAALG
jgi:hypothetical protein